MSNSQTPQKATNVNRIPLESLSPPQNTATPQKKSLFADIAALFSPQPAAKPDTATEQVGGRRRHRVKVTRRRKGRRHHYRKSQRK